jgi:hypothetical protein
VICVLCWIITRGKARGSHRFQHYTYNYSVHIILHQRPSILCFLFIFLVNNRYTWLIFIYIVTCEHMQMVCIFFFSFFYSIIITTQCPSEVKPCNRTYLPVIIIRVKSRSFYSVLFYSTLWHASVSMTSKNIYQ